MGDTRSFGQIIRRRRNALGLSQARLGELVGRSPSTIRKWERGETTPASRKDAVALAAVLGLDESEVLAGAGFEVEDSSPRETIEEAYASLRREDTPQAETEEPPVESAPIEPEPPPESTAPPRVVPRAAPPVVLERTGGGEPSYLEDPLERAWYRRRAVATAAVVIFLVIVFLWAWEAATAALADLWEDLFSMLQI